MLFRREFSMLERIEKKRYMKQFMRISPMPRCWSALLAAGLMFAASGTSSYAQTTVTTVPVGFIRVQVAPAQNAASPALTAVSVPFYGAALYAGAAASLASTQTINVTGAAWTPNQFVSPPTFCRIKSGAGTGAFFPVASNTATQLTLNTGGATLVSGTPTTPQQVQVLAGDKIEIVPATTLGGLFGATSVPFQTGAGPATADNILLFNGTGWNVFYHNGTAWQSPGAAGDQAGAVIPPDGAFFVVRRSTTPLSVYVAGTVPSTQEVLYFPVAASRFVGSRFPADTTLAGLGLHLNPNWRTGPSAAQADSLLVWTGATWQSFYHNGAQWRRAGSFQNFDALPVPAGSGVFVARKPGGTGDALVFLQLPYTF
jgi:uncharacterized protein (TIGR02597 family)